jgi:hypothetical protein
MAIGNLPIEDYVPVVKVNDGLYTEKTIETTGNLVVAGTAAITGSLTPTGVLNASAAGIRTIQSVANVTEAAPTDAQLDSAFGTPAALGRGFIGTIDDNDGSTASVLVWTTDTAWFHVVGVLST